MSGYDTAQRTKESDDLGRWQFASEIADVIRSTPSDWSARIGIFGKWGEGKSTVLHFLKEMLKPEGNVVFDFNPWAVQELDELWDEFGKSLIDALKEAKLYVESPVKGMARSLRERMESSGTGDLAEGAAAFFGKDKVYKGALGFVGKWLKPDGEQVRKIREGLENKRLVVIVDDLDRATPELLPKLLLSLREILDLPGFTFVLAFDNEIVSQCLVNANSAWADGDSFLDKILDFRYYLPTISENSKRALLNKMIERYCPFVPKESIETIEYLLPDNPRKLKMLIRGLVSLKPQLVRHGPDELNWVEIWLAQMIRQESYSFFVRLLDEKTLEKLAGYEYRFNKSSNKSREESVDNTDIEKLIEEIGGINRAQAERLIQLVTATRTLGGYSLRYNWKFAHHPEAITWQEFHELEALWNKHRTPKDLATWLEKHSVKFSIDRSALEADFFQTLVNAKNNAMSAAAEAIPVEENDKQCARAESLLTMTFQFLGLPEMLTGQRFQLLFEQSLHWIAFRVNPADLRLREAEKRTLYSLIDRAADSEAAKILDLLRPHEWWPEPGDADTIRLRKELRDGCLSRLVPKAELAFIAYLARPECFRILGSKQGSSAFRNVIFSEDRFPWDAVVRDAIFRILENSKIDLNDHEKANDLLNLILEASRNRSSYVSQADSQRILTDLEFVKVLWHAVTARPIQYRMVSSYLGRRDALIGLGVAQEDLPLSRELEAARDQLAAGKSSFDEQQRAEKSTDQGDPG
jgi:hypothetical protein